MVQGFLLLALAQIPLSLGNSFLATHQLVRDYFPSRSVTLKKIGWTYSLMNIVAPLFGGIPVCHGSGGIAGHYLFGARTGGSVLIYGILFLVLGLFFSAGFSEIITVFPLPILGVILLFEGTALMKLVQDTLDSPSRFLVAILVGLICVGVPYGYVVGMVTGTAMVSYLKYREGV
jgi:MFS superfamily sulfate permease-like transporter